MYYYGTRYYDPKISLFIWVRCQRPNFSVSYKEEDKAVLTAVPL